ncbi:phosphatase PAP2 family protein [Microvirga lenta]|uniref:phosphatase PAP2 family protein n=1 Tax=Microvirga lenta TaxID=2881337 RepID=UPI001CFEE9CE|nr:phosphatase PAP2 family protein [Microvirga lenta]MCB5174485.1 phosphatase PAP2 family protein [Microvirga lenta]
MTILLYFIAAQLLAVATGNPHRLRPLMYLTGWLTTVLSCLALYLLGYRIPKALLADPRRPLRAILNTVSSLMAPRLLAGGLLLVSLGVFFGTFTSVKNLLPEIVPFWSDPLLADIDEALHGGTAPWLLLHPLIGDPETTRAIELTYMLPWSVMMAGTQVLLAIHPKLSQLRGQYYSTYLGAWILLGSGLACIGMSAGPVYYGDVTGDNHRFSALVEYLSFSDGLISSAAGIRNYLWNAYQSKDTWLSSGISAFPSMHVATTTLLALAGWVLNRWLGFALAAFWLVILVSSVHLGWHYAIDGYVSTLCTIAIWMVAGRFYRGSEPQAKGRDLWSHA